jgi:hypothetical protein
MGVAILFPFDVNYLLKASCQFVTGNGYIEGTELDGFLKEFVSSANASDVSPEVRLGNKTLLSKHDQRRMQYI